MTPINRDVRDFTAQIPSGAYTSNAINLGGFALAGLFVPGGLGENLAIEGLDEAGICVGDVHAIGTAALQVCQPRRPCFNLALRFGDNRMPKAMVRTGRAGWYYRVVAPGVIAAGDAVVLAERPAPGFAFARLVEIVSHGGASRDELERMAGMAGIAGQWRVQAKRVLSGISEGDGA